AVRTGKAGELFSIEAGHAAIRRAPDRSVGITLQPPNEVLGETVEGGESFDAAFFDGREAKRRDRCRRLRITHHRRSAFRKNKPARGQTPELVRARTKVNKLKMSVFIADGGLNDFCSRRSII